MNTTILALIELRKRLMMTISVFIVLFALFFYMSDALFYYYMRPLQQMLSPQQPMLASQITSPLLTPLSMAMNLALLSTAPYALFQLWRFAAPGLYLKEQRQLLSVICLSLALFVLGAGFCYFMILPVMFQCIIHGLPKGVLFLPDIGSAAQFITWMMIIFGISFQLPLVCALTVRLQWMSIQQLVLLRPYMIVLAFILGMLLTPPDVLSQILLALPLWGLFETGIWFARISTDVTKNDCK